MKFTQFYQGSKKLGGGTLYGDDITVLKDKGKYFQFVWGDGLDSRWRLEITREVYQKLLRTGKYMVESQGWIQVV